MLCWTEGSKDDGLDDYDDDDDGDGVVVHHVLKT